MTNALIAAGLIVFLLAALRVQGATVAQGTIAASASRKLAHVVLGAALVLTWLLYEAGPAARWFAAAVPGILGLAFVALGTGVWRNDAIVRAASRSGRRHEFLHGPVYYTIAFATLTAVFWRTSPVGMSALMIMITGDGLAEVAGRAIPSPRIPWNREKSIAGSAAVLVGGWLGAAAAVAVFTVAGYLTGAWTAYLVPLTAVAAAGAVAETIPVREIDNLTVPLAAAVVGYIVLGA